MGWEARRWASTWPARRTAAPGIEWPCSLTHATSAPSVRATRSPRARSPLQTETDGAPGGERDRVLLVPRLHDGQHRAGHALAQQLRAGRHAAQDRGGVERARHAVELERAAAQQRGAARDGLGDELLDPRARLGRAQRADLGLGLPRVAGAQPLRGRHDRRDQRLGHRRAPRRGGRPRRGGGRRRRTRPTARRSRCGPAARRRARASCSSRAAGACRRRASASALRSSPGGTSVISSERHPAALERRAHALAQRRREDHGVARQQRGGRLEHGLGPRRRRRRRGSPTVPRGACTSSERRPARRAGMRPSRRSRSARGPWSARSWRPPTDGSSSASIASVRGWPTVSASASARPSSSSRIAVAVRRR